MLLLVLTPAVVSAQESSAAESEPPTAPIVTVPDVIAPGSTPSEAMRPPSTETAAPSPGPLDWLFGNGGSVVAIATISGGLVGALGVGALTFLSPCYCGCCLFSMPIGAASAMAGATLGIGLARGWHCSQFWAPALVASALGGTAGLVASVVGVIVAQASGSTINTRTYLPEVATGSALIPASLSGGAACLTMVIGSVAAAGAAVLVYKFQDSFERDEHEIRGASRERESTHATAPMAVAY